MTRDGDKHPALALLARPEQRLRLSVLVAGGEQRCAFWIAGELPVAFVVQVQTLEVAGDRVAGTKLKIEIKLAVAELRRTTFPREANPLGKAGRIAAAIDGIVDVNRSTTAIEECIQVAGSFG